MKEDIYRNLKFLGNAFLYNSPIIIIIIFLLSLSLIIEISSFFKNGYIIIGYIIFSFCIWILAIQKKKKMKKEIKENGIKKIGIVSYIGEERDDDNLGVSYKYDIKDSNGKIYEYGYIGIKYYIGDKFYIYENEKYTGIYEFEYIEEDEKK